jgi:hypothetical protein
MAINDRTRVLEIAVEQVKSVLEFDRKRLSVEPHLDYTDVVLKDVSTPKKDFYLQLCVLTSNLINVCGNTVSIQATPNFFGDNLHRVILKIQWNKSGNGSHHERVCSERKGSNKNNNP